MPAVKNSGRFFYYYRAGDRNLCSARIETRHGFYAESASLSESRVKQIGY